MGWVEHTFHNCMVVSSILSLTNSRTLNSDREAGLSDVLAIDWRKWKDNLVGVQ